MPSILNHIESHGDRFLIMDGRLPVISGGLVRDELRLYNLNIETMQQLLANLPETVKDALRGVTMETQTARLSGGQKIIFATLFALASPAPRILFINFFRPLFPATRRVVLALVETARGNREEIRIINEDMEEKLLNSGETT